MSKISHECLMNTHYDRIIIQNLRLRCFIGFSEHELRDKQDVVISMTLFTDIRKGGESDNPDDILNYRTVNKAVIAHVENSRYKTIEALASSIAKLAVIEYAVPRIQVEVYKPGALRFTDSVGVIIERTLEDF
ncbi:MAG TPA: dihydroneopterin aldolase [Aggregatilineales bacterium]|nr:dihydroneopterin aldolase [Aggregatilineales bacterium]